MRKKLWLPLGLLVAAFLLLGLGAKAQAWTEFKGGDNVTVASNETIDSSLWAGGKNIDIAGTVNGDVFCGGQTVNISGSVKGDVICAGQTITITGSIEGSVRLLAQTINLNGQIARNASAAAQTINADSESLVGGDASFAVENVNLNGTIGRDLAVAGSSASLSGEVKRDIKSSVEKLSLTGNAKVGGSVSYTSKDKIQVSGNAKVAGTVTQHQPKQEKEPWVRLLFFTGVGALFFSVVLLLTAFIITALIPQLVHAVSGQGLRRFWRALLVGFVASIVVPVLGILLMISVVGIPLGILLFLSWLLIALSSGLFSAYYVGRRFWTGQNNPVFRVLLGGAILLLLAMVPFVGGLVVLLSFWLGAGMLLLELKDRRPSPKYELK
jgi:hypothetical protein